MASKRNPSDPAGPGSRQSRRPQTIELEATEVSSDAGNASASASSASSEMRAGDTRLQAVHTPGHAPDHVSFLDLDSRDVYSGDLVRADGSIVIPASRGGLPPSLM